MKKVFMFVNVDWFFFSHRLPIAKASKKNDVDMIVYTDFTMRHKIGFDDGYELCQSPISRTSKSFFHFIYEFLKCYLLIADKKPDLIHAITIKPILLLGLVARLTSTSFLGAVSGLGPAFQPHSKFGKFRLKAIIWALRFIFSKKKSAVICQSKNDSDVLLNHGIVLPEQITLIPGSGVDIEAFSPDKKRDNNEEYILMSSRILSDKGVKDFCSAAKIVGESHGKRIKFKLSGPIDIFSPTFISESDLSKLLIDSGVEYLGNRKDMPELLASSTIFVLPSYYAEGIPKVLLEAAACGVPIITTNHPGCRDAILDNKTGLLVDAKNPEALAKAIIKLLDNKILLSEMGNNGRALAESTFTDLAVVNSHYKIYTELFII